LHEHNSKVAHAIRFDGSARLFRVRRLALCAGGGRWRDGWGVVRLAVRPGGRVRTGAEAFVPVVAEHAEFSVLHDFSFRNRKYETGPPCLWQNLLPSTKAEHDSVL
jgi:hypothetical protein